MGDQLYQSEPILEQRVGVFSDIHLGLGQDSEIWHEVMLEFAEWAAKEFKQREITDILIPGDVFHNRNEIALRTLDTGHKFFEIFKDFRTIIGGGNHDIHLRNSNEINSLSVLKGRNNIHIIDVVPKLFGIKNSTRQISMIPWGTKVIDLPKADICFGHFELATFALNNHKICQHGEDVQNLFTKSPMIVTGHFHKREHRTYKNGEVLYLGSPYQHNFGDIGDTRGIYVMDLETAKFEFIENRISPRHFKISVNQICNGKLKIEQLKTLVPGNMICLVIDKNLSVEQLSSITAKVQGLNPRFFRLDYDATGIVTDGNNSSNYTSIDILAAIETFIQSTNSQHKQETLEYLTELYNNIT